MVDTNTSGAVLHCIVVTPEETVLESEASFVALPLFDGEIGIGLHHSPMIGRLGYGEMRITTEGETSRYYVDGGFVQVADNVVSVLTNRALPAEDLDGEAAQAQISEALGQRTAGTEELAIRDRLLSQARAQLRVANKAK